MEELKPIRRQAEKERRRERAVQLAEGYAAGTLNAEEKALVESRRAKERERRVSKRKGPEKGVDQEAWKGGVIIDLGFDELMTDQVRRSLVVVVAVVVHARLQWTGADADADTNDIGDLVDGFPAGIPILNQPIRKDTYLEHRAHLGIIRVFA
jgi:hypothetical protein